VVGAWYKCVGPIHVVCEFDNKDLKIQRQAVTRLTHSVPFIFVMFRDATNIEYRIILSKIKMRLISINEYSSSVIY